MAATSAALTSAFPSGEFAPGRIALVEPEGVREVADDLAFPNGMAITPDGRILLVAESYAERLTAYDIGLDAPSATGGCGRTRPATIRTGSVSMRKVPCGSPMSATSAAYGSARAARSSRR
jgi:sugar lactone lactonase YvrE